MAIEEIHRSKTLNEQQLRAVLDQLDEQDASGPSRDRRGNARHSYRRTKLRVRITQPGGGSAMECDVPSRNLSSGGMSLLYWAFLYNGTEVRITLRRRVGGDEAVLGKVVYCKHVTGQHHSIGVKFNQRIFPKLYIDGAEAGESDDAVVVKPGEIHGRVLLVDAQEMDRKLFAHHMQKTKLEIVSVPNEKQALEQIQGGKFEIVLCELNLEGTTGEKLIASLRGNGFTGPIIALTGESSPQRLIDAEAAGAASVVQKPYNPERLIGIIAGFLNCNGVSSDEKIFSDLATNPSMETLIQQYVQKVRDLAARINMAIQKSDLEGIRQVCQILRGSGSNFGFPQVTKAAKEAVVSLDANMSIEQSLAQIQQVEALCRRVAAGKSAK